MNRRKAFKLVRDFIPAMARHRGDRAKFDIVRSPLLDRLIVEKMIEEAQELLGADGSNEAVERMAAIYELMGEWVRLRGISLDHLREVAKDKDRIKGGFHYGFVMEINE